MRFVVTPLLLTCLTFGCSQSADDLLARGDELSFTQQYAAAAKAYEAAVIESQESLTESAAALRATALNKLGALRHVFLADVQGALRAYRSVAEVAPGTKHAFEARRAIVGLLRDRVNDPAAAADELAALLDAFPDHPESPTLRLELAQLSLRAGKTQAAIQQAEALLEEADGKLLQQTALLLASIYKGEKRQHEALALYEALLADDLDPATAATVRLEAGNCLEALGRFQEAITAYEGARRGPIDHEIVAALVTRARARLDAGRRHGRPVRGRTQF